jgi:hypothetical protein
VLKKFVCDDDEKISLCGIYLEFKRKTLSSDFCSTFVFLHHHLELFLIAKVFLLEKELELFLSLQTFHNTFSAYKGELKNNFPRFQIGLIRKFLKLISRGQQQPKGASIHRFPLCDF